MVRGGGNEISALDSYPTSLIEEERRFRGGEFGSVRAQRMISVSMVKHMNAAEPGSGVCAHD